MPEEPESNVAVIDPGPDKIIGPGNDYGTVTDKISGVIYRPFLKTPKQMFIGFACAFVLVNLLMVAVTWLFIRGVGIWGIVIPVAWGFAIVNFVWWIGIGHAGTLISAILLLLKQDWRTSINRFSEAMTLFAVACAGMFPILHLGRPWLAYWLLPYPNTMWLWPQPRSPLIWDVFAVSTYATVSLIFWFTGLIPDFATMRDKRPDTVAGKIFGLLAMGWRGSAKHWARYQKAYLLLAGLSTPLVVSVHSVVSFDFAVAILPGWHTTIFPPYFVAGAIYSGFAMVLTLAIPVRRWYHLEDLITMRHIECMAKVMLGTGLIVAYGYAMEAFMAWYSAATEYERYAFYNRMWAGDYWWTYWLLILCNILIPQLLWSRKVRLHVSGGVRGLAGGERGDVAGAVRDRGDQPDPRFRPVQSGDITYPTFWDWSTYAGTIGVFLCLMFLFVRGLPAISIFEMREVVHRRWSTRMPTEIRAAGQLEKLYGLMAEFDQPEQLLAAAERARDEGYRDMDAYAPMPVEGLAEAIGFRQNWVQRLCSSADFAARRGGFSLCWWITVIAYPHNVAGQAAEQLARLCADHFRADGAGCVPHGGDRDAGVQRAAAAVSSGV